MRKGIGSNAALRDLQVNRLRSGRSNMQAVPDLQSRAYLELAFLRAQALDAPTIQYPAIGILFDR